MSVTFPLVISLFAFGFLLDTLADILDLKSLAKSRVDPETSKLYSPEDLTRAIAYHRQWRRFALLKRTIGAILFLLFWFFGGFGFVDGIARGLGAWPPATGVLFAGLLLLFRFIVELPFAVHGTFGIEARFGFNRTTPRVFMEDLLKGILLSALLGAPLFGGIIWFFERTGAHGWVWAWGFVSGFQLILAYLAPRILLPLFNRFEPLPEGPLKARIEEFCRKVDFQVSGVFLMDGSKRSSKANAFFTGFGAHRRLVLFDTLLQKLEEDELIAVLAHEVGHFKERHIRKFLALSVLSTGAAFYFFSFFIGNASLTEVFGVFQPSIYAGLVFVGLLYGPISRVLGIAVHALSRRFEFAADAYAAKHFGAPEKLASGLIKISTDALANPAPHAFRIALDYSHPPVPQRIKVLRELTTQSACAL